VRSKNIPSGKVTGKFEPYSYKIGRGTITLLPLTPPGQASAHLAIQ